MAGLKILRLGENTFLQFTAAEQGSDTVAVTAVGKDDSLLSRADQLALLAYLECHLAQTRDPGCDCQYIAPEIREAGQLCSQCRKIRYEAFQKFSQR